MCLKNFQASTSHMEQVLWELLGEEGCRGSFLLRLCGRLWTDNRAPHFLSHPKLFNQIYLVTHSLPCSWSQ